MDDRSTRDMDSGTIRTIMEVLESSEVLKRAEARRRNPIYSYPQLFAVDLLRDIEGKPYGKVNSVITDDLCEAIGLPKRRDGTYRIPSAGRLNKFVLEDWPSCSDENWIFLCLEKHIGFVTSFKVNSTPKKNGCEARGEAARLWCELPYDEWVKASGYGTRWKCECTFSDFKRLFPEVVTARSEMGMIRQVICRIDFHNLYKETRARIMGVTGNGIAVA